MEFRSELKKKTTQFRNAKEADVFNYDALLCNRLYQACDIKVAVFWEINNNST